MTLTESSATERLSKQRSYRRLMYGFVFGGVALALALRFLDYPVLGEAVYWVGIVAGLAVWRGTSLSLFDERDRALERRASQLTLSLIAAVAVVGASAARMLHQVGGYTASPEIWGALYGYAGLFAVFGLVYLGLRYRP